MANRDGEDSAPLRPPEAPTAPDPLQRVRAAAMAIHQILRKNYRDARLPGPGELTFFVAVCSQVADWAPRWTPQAVGRARRRPNREHKDMPPKFYALQPPSLEMFSAHPSRALRAEIAERPARLHKLAVAEVRRRSANEDVEITRIRLAAQGPLPRRWALALRLFAPPLAAILLQAGAPVSTRSHSPFTNTCRYVLQLLLPHEKTRSGSTVSYALRKIIAIT